MDARIATPWNYAAAASGIVNTLTAVTIKAAAGAGIRNYLSSLQLASDALGGATEFVIRDGAGGTVLWRGKLQTTAMVQQTFNFDPPLRSTANTLLEVATLTAVTGGVYVNAQGYTGA
jgi:predicted ATPase